MVLEKREIIGCGRKETFKISGSSNKLICERGLYYIATPDGKALTRPYEKITEFVNGKAVFWDKETCGVISSNGKVISKKSYDKVVLDGDIIRVYKNGNWGFTDFDGKVLCSPKYAFVEKFSNGLARVKTHDELWGIINDKGRIVIEPKYKYLGKPDKLLIVAQNVWGYGVIDIKDKVVEPFKYRRISTDEDVTVIYNTDGQKRTEQYTVAE